MGASTSDTTRDGTVEGYPEKILLSKYLSVNSINFSRHRYFNERLTLTGTSRKSIPQVLQLVSI